MVIKISVSAVILAGGKNSRMLGEEKAFLEIEGRPIIARIIEKLKTYAREVILVTNSSFDKYSKFVAADNVKLVKDKIPNKGPLMGIYSGLKASAFHYSFIVACDMPFINEALIRHMIVSIDNYDVIIPKIDEKFHPLFGIYSKNCIPVIEELLKQDSLRVLNLFPHVKCRFLLRQEIETFDEGLLSLVNINTREDYNKYLFESRD